MYMEVLFGKKGHNFHHLHGVPDINYSTDEGLKQGLVN